jgi:NADH-quinone oxidoreductase subunit N
MRRIAFINEKGGTCKTTLCVNTAAWLARRHGRRVLVCDLDTQGHAGKSLGIDVRGLRSRAPLAAVALAVCLFSLTGLPPSIGFTGKWYLFVAVMERGLAPGGFWYATLAVIAALNTVVSLFYYARILRAMFLEAPLDETPVESPPSYQFLLTGFAGAVVLFGLWWTPMIDWTGASLQIFRG